jgi:hypothetical protein
MQLVYRGVNYSSPSLSNQNNRQLYYRGAKYSSIASSRPNNIQLSYRGAKYFPGFSPEIKQLASQELTYRGNIYYRES